MCAPQTLVGMHRLTSMRGNLVIPREGGLASLGLGPAFTLPPHVWSGTIPWTNVDRTRWGEPAHPWEMMKVGRQQQPEHDEPPVLLLSFLLQAINRTSTTERVS